MTDQRKPWEVTRDRIVCGMAFPAQTAIGHRDFAPGLSKRELFAAMVLQGLVGAMPHMPGPATVDGNPITEEALARQAAAFSDALIAALQSPEGGS